MAKAASVFSTILVVCCVCLFVSGELHLVESDYNVIEYGMTLPSFDLWSVAPVQFAIDSEELYALIAHFPHLPFTVLEKDINKIADESLFRQLESTKSEKWLKNQIFHSVQDNSVTFDMMANLTNTWFQNYHSYDDILLYMQALHQVFPERTQLFSIGKTYEGNLIEGIRIAGPDGFSNDKPEMIYNACQHAREWIRSPATAMYFANNLLFNNTEDTELGELLKNFYYSIIPVVNVDGYKFTWSTDRLWRKNRSFYGNGTECKGTDINRNWEFQWGGVGASPDPCNSQYHGPNSFSELETTALSEYMKTFDNIAAYVDFHSYGQLILLPWCYTSDDTSDHEEQLSVGKSMDTAIKQIHGKNYLVGKWYRALYPSSGTSIDWVYSEGMTALSYTIELRDRGEYGFELPPNEIIPTGQEIIAALKVLGDSAVDN